MARRSSISAQVWDSTVAASWRGVKRRDALGQRLCIRSYSGVVSVSLSHTRRGLWYTYLFSDISGIR